MNIFIDCGAFRGKIISRFLASRENPIDWLVYALECNPMLVDFNYGPGIVKMPFAAWTKCETLKFYLSKRNKDKVEGSSIFKKKITGDLDTKNPTEVRAIDFSAWVKSAFTERDKIILKMNIEGAEYPVLSKMVDDGTIRMISEIYVKWHWQKIQMPIEQHRAVVEKVITSGVKYFTRYEDLYARK